MKSTIVSLYHSSWDEPRPGQIPPLWIINAGGLDSPSLTVISDAVNPFNTQNEKAPPMMIPVPGEVNAASIVFDFLKSKMEVEEGVCQPGVFWFPGVKALDVVKKEHAEELAVQRGFQVNWYKRLINVADDMWSKRPGAYRLVSDDAREAARVLKIDRPWTQVDNSVMLKTVLCVACKSTIPSDAVVCMHCRTVQNADAYKNLKVASV